MTLLPPKVPTQQSVDRRKAFAEALMRAGMPQGQQAGRFYVAPSPWASLASGIQNLAGAWQQRKAGDEQKTVNDDWSAKFTDALLKGGSDPAAVEQAKLLPIDQQRTLLGQMTATRLAPKPVSGRAPVVIAGADGKPQYANAEDAVGKAPYFEPGNSPAKVQEYQFAQQNGFKGTYADFLKIGQGGIGNFNPGDYTPESFARFSKSNNPNDLIRYVAPATPTVQTINQVPTLVAPSRTGEPTRIEPLSTLPQVATSAQTVKAAEAEGSAVGKGRGEVSAEAAKKANSSGNVLAQLDMADPLIDQATGSGLGAIADEGAAFFGGADAGAKAIGQLKVLEATLVQNMPRLEGPQSDRDTQLYKEAAAQLGNPEVPRDIKKAALQTIRQIQQRYAQAFSVGASGVPDLSQAKPSTDYSSLSNEDLLRQLGQ